MTGGGGGAPIGGGAGTGGGGPSPGLVFFDDFEGGLGNWWATNGVWEVGIPTSGPEGAHSGSNVAATILAGNFPNISSSLVSPTITLPAISTNEELHLRFWHWFSFGGNGGVVYIQEQTSPGVWSAATALFNYSALCGGVWTRPVVDLSVYAGKKVRILFGLVNYGGTVSSGWYIDDVSIAVVQANRTVPFLETFEGGLGDWWASNGVWEVGKPTSGPLACASGELCAGTVLAGNFPNVTSAFVSPTIDLPTIGAAEELHLRFWHWFSFGGNSGTVYIQEQTSPGVWGPSRSMMSISGSSGVWTRPAVDVSTSTGKKVRALFGLINHGGTVSSGWYIDDITVDVVQSGLIP